MSDAVPHETSTPQSLAPIDSTTCQSKVAAIDESRKLRGDPNPEPPAVAAAREESVVPTHVPSPVANWGPRFQPTALTF